MDNAVENMTRWIGSVPSLLLHTVVFVSCGILGWMHILPWDTVLLGLTTAVSLEAIYLAIFIQMSVNQNAAELREVGADVDEIQKDVDEIQEDVDEIQEDIEEIEQDVDEISEEDDEEETREKQQQEMLTTMSAQLKDLLAEVEKMRKTAK